LIEIVHEQFKFPKFADHQETDSVLGDIATIEARRNAVFRPDTKQAITSSSPFQNLQSHSSETLNLRQYTTKTFEWLQQNNKLKKSYNAEDIATDVDNLTPSLNKPLSSREKHELTYWTPLQDAPDSGFVYNKLKQLFRSRAKEGYLFNCLKNQKILAEDPWLQDVWVWIEGSYRQHHVDSEY
jgi:hypothetical protein